MPAPSFLRPERRLDAEFVDGLDDAAKVMAENLTQHFVSLRDGCLAPQTFAELRLNHAEGRLDVETLVAALTDDGEA